MGLIGNSNLRFIWVEKGDKVENFYDTHNYDRGNYQERSRSDSRDRRNQYRQSRGRLRYEQNYRRGNL